MKDCPNQYKNSMGTIMNCILKHISIAVDALSLFYEMVHFVFEREFVVFCSSSKLYQVNIGEYGTIFRTE